MRRPRVLSLAVPTAPSAAIRDLAPLTLDSDDWRAAVDAVRAHPVVAAARAAAATLAEREAVAAAAARLVARSLAAGAD